MSGKKAKVLEAEDIYQHFKEIGAYKGERTEKELMLFQKPEYAYDNGGFALEEGFVSKEAVIVKQDATKEAKMLVLDQEVVQNNQVNISGVLQMLSLMYELSKLNLDLEYDNYHYEVDDDCQRLIGDNLRSDNSDLMFGNSQMICCTA